MNNCHRNYDKTLLGIRDQVVWSVRTCFWDMTTLRGDTVQYSWRTTDKEHDTTATDPPTLARITRNNIVSPTYKGTSQMGREKKGERTYLTPYRRVIKRIIPPHDRVCSIGET